MSNFRLRTFSEPEQYAQACIGFDDSFMNFPLGSLLDSMSPINTVDGGDQLQTTVEQSLRILLAVYKAEQLIVCLLRISDEFAWMLGTPRGVEEELSAKDVAAVISLLVPGIAAAAGTKGFDKVIGPRALVNSLIDGWVSYAAEHGQAVKALDPFFTSKVSYATRASLPPPCPALSHLKIEQLTKQEDAEALVSFMLDFLTHGPQKPNEEQVRRQLQVAMYLSHVWICRVDGELAGYISVGRVTPRTVAIRNVYVAPSHRRKGIAEALTRAVSRLYLGVEPVGIEGAPLDGPADGVKDEVCLNVAEKDVERIYTRSGFLIDQQDPATGKQGWFHSSFRGIEYL
ncbi:hypothetical protein BC835DRAFT_1262716 [Cytidiella melzeri]|nr:hypothetical protein BC835DRAFT_1262716 [Cytidiella melzeri]